MPKSHVKRKLRGRQVILVDAQIIRWRKSRKQAYIRPEGKVRLGRPPKIQSIDKLTIDIIKRYNFFGDVEDDNK